MPSASAASTETKTRVRIAVLIIFSCLSVWREGARDHASVACCVGLCCVRLNQSSDFEFQDQNSGVSVIRSTCTAASHIPARHPIFGLLAVRICMPSKGSRRKAGATNPRRAARQGGEHAVESAASILLPEPYRAGAQTRVCMNLYCRRINQSTNDPSCYRAICKVLVPPRQKSCPGSPGHRLGQHNHGWSHELVEPTLVFANRHRTDSTEQRLGIWVPTSEQSTSCLFLLATRILC